MKAVLVLVATLVFASITSNASILLCEGGAQGVLVNVVRDNAEACSSTLIIEVDGQRTCIVDDEARQITNPGEYQVCGAHTLNGFKVLKAQSALLR